jgi:glycine/D-amino acid oxidase-like deaminating enzyme
MGGGETPKGFPVPNPTKSYWQLPPHHLANHRTTSSLPTEAIWDYVIIGSGISGVATAYKLRSRNAYFKILMLEARTAASGASGRNGGHCRPGWWLNFKEYADAFGEEEAIKFETLEEQNVQDIADFVHERNVECDFQDVETADAFVTHEAWAQVLDVLKTREEVGKGVRLIKRRVLDGREAEKQLGINGLVGAVTYAAHTQNPYLLVCRMLELSLAKGLNLQTNTPAFSISPIGPSKSQGGARWTVETDRGNLRAKNVVLATNAYTNALLPSLAKTDFLKPSRSQVTAIRPAKGDLLHHPSVHKSVGLDDRPPSGDYFLTRAPHLKGAGDVLYGGGRAISPTREMGTTDDSIINPKIGAYLKSSVPQIFGKEVWGDESNEVRDWSGITCYTPDTFPLVGEIPAEKGLWASVGMNGHGMAMAFRSAEALVCMMAGEGEPDWFPKSFRIARAWDEEKVNLSKLSL